MSHVNVRKAHRSHVSKTIKNIEDVLKSEKVDSNLLNAYRQNLVEKMLILMDLDDKILAELTEEDGITNEIENSSDFNLKIQTSIFSTDEILTEINGANKGMVGMGMSLPKPNTAKLPKIEIKPFYSNPINFQSFWDSFEANINSNRSLEDATKFSYLKSMLHDQALAVIQGLSLLMNIKPVTAINDIKKVRQVFDFVEVHVRNLHTLEIETDQYGALHVSIVISKLPSDIKLHVSREMPLNEGWDVTLLLHNLKKEIESRKMCSRLSGCSTDIVRSNDDTDNYDDEPFTAATLHPGGRREDISCTYCQRKQPSP